MKKSFVVAPWWFGLATLPVVSRAEGGVVFYGLLDIGLQYNQITYRDGETSLGGTFFGMAGGVQSGSRWGLRGAEDLGDGVSAVFVLESGFNVGDGNTQQGGRLFGRQATIGLTSRQWGRIDFGRQTNLASNYLMPMDPFAEGFGQANIGASFGATNTLRYSNMVLVQTPLFEGLRFGAGYAFSSGLTAIYVDNGACGASGCTTTPADNGFATGNNLRTITLGVSYEKGPVQLAASYDQANGAANIPGGAPPVGPREWILGGAYDFHVVKASVAVGQARNGGFTGQPAGTGATGLPLVADATLGAGVLFWTGYDHNSYLLGLAVPTSDRGNLLGSWQMMQPAGDLASTGVVQNQQIISLGYTYALTPRTNVYAYASYANHFAMIDNTQSTVTGLGIRHQF